MKHFNQIPYDIAERASAASLAVALGIGALVGARAIGVLPEPLGRQVDSAVLTSYKGADWVSGGILPDMTIEAPQTGADLYGSIYGGNDNGVQQYGRRPITDQPG